MSHRPILAAALALPLLAGAASAQDTPRTVGVAVDGIVVELPVDLAAQACGVSAETLLEQWAQLDTQMATMAATSVAADATDLAPVASPEDTQKASGVGPMVSSEGGAAGASQAAEAEASPAPEAGTQPTASAGSAASTGATAEGSAAAKGAVGGSASPDTSAAVAGASGDLSPVVAAASPAASAAENPQAALNDSAAPAEGTPLSKAAVCQIDAAKAAELGIQTPG